MWLMLVSRKVIPSIGQDTRMTALSAAVLAGHFGVPVKSSLSNNAVMTWVFSVYSVSSN